MNMKSRAKAQAELPAEPKNATSLANDLHEENVVDYVGYRYDGHKRTPLIEPVKIDDLKPGDQIIDPKHLKKFHALATPHAFKERERKAKRSKWKRFGVLSIMTALGVISLLMADSIDEIESLVWRTLAASIILIPLMVGLPFSTLGAIVVSTWGHRWLIDDREIKECPSLEFKEPLKNNGEPYEVNDPTHEELYEAMKLMNKLKEYVKSTRSLNAKLKSLHVTHGNSDESNVQMESYKKLELAEIASQETRIAELLASTRSLSESATTV